MATVAIVAMRQAMAKLQTLAMPQALATRQALAMLATKAPLQTQELRTRLPARPPQPAPRAFPRSRLAVTAVPRQLRLALQQ